MAPLFPNLPQPCLIGRPKTWEWRDILDAIFYVTKTGCQWRASPGYLPPWQSVYRYFPWLSEVEWWRKLNDYLSQEWRLEQGREANPSAGSIDSQSVKARETGSSHGFAAGKKIKGTKHHLLVDTQGLIVTCLAHSAKVQDYDGVGLVFDQTQACGRNARLKLIWADGSYDKDRVKQKAAQYYWQVQVIKRSDDAKGFELLPRRWVVGRTFGWLMHQRRLARDYERLARNAQSFIYLSMCRLLLT